jgi:hypothetical protein
VLASRRLTVDGGAEEVALFGDGLAGVEADADADGVGGFGAWWLRSILRYLRMSGKGRGRSAGGLGEAFTSTYGLPLLVGTA